MHITAKSAGSNHFFSEKQCFNACIFWKTFHACSTMLKSKSLLNKAWYYVCPKTKTSAHCKRILHCNRLRSASTLGWYSWLTKGGARRFNTRVCKSNTVLREICSSSLTKRALWICICMQSGINRTPHPQLGGTLSQGLKIQSSHHLPLKESVDSLNWKIEEHVVTWCVHASARFRQVQALGQPWAGTISHTTSICPETENSW